MEKGTDAEKPPPLESLLKFACKEGLLDKERYKSADCVRQKANEAVHGEKLPEQKDCEDALHKTRGVLEHLYGRLQ